MNLPAQTLEIHLHKADGSSAKFIQSEAGLAKRILDELNLASRMPI